MHCIYIDLKRSLITEYCDSAVRHLCAPRKWAVVRWQNNLLWW